MNWSPLSLVFVSRGLGLPLRRKTPAAAKGYGAWEAATEISPARASGEPGQRSGTPLGISPKQLLVGWMDLLAENNTGTNSCLRGKIRKEWGVGLREESNKEARHKREVNLKIIDRATNLFQGDEDLKAD